MKMSGWSVEELHDGYGQMLQEDTVLYDSETVHQRLRVFENKKLGRVLTLDGVVQTTTSDEYMYHEMLSHVPILAHGAAKRVLIIGGGDGGVAREVLRHKTVEHVTMVEIDAGVVDFSKEYLPTISDGAFEDPRLELVIADGAAFVRDTELKFDVVVVDSTDPIGPGEVLFTDTFYDHCKSMLTEDGIIVTQNGVPFMQGEELTGTMRAFKALFTDWTCYLTHVPTYAGGPMALGWGSMKSKASKVDLIILAQRFTATGIKTRYYTPEIHKAAFALPKYIQALMP